LDDVFCQFAEHTQRCEGKGDTSLSFAMSTLRGQNVYAAIVQARLGSERLPKKVLSPLPDGETVLSRIIKNLRKCRMIDDIVITTPDNEIAEYAQQLNVCWSLYNGERDVLAEYYQAAQAFKIDVIVRITADCPLIVPELVDSVVIQHLCANADYTCNRNDDDNDMDGDGYDVEVFGLSALTKAYNEAIEPYDREHVTPYFRKGKFNILKLPAPKLPGCSVNVYADLETVCNIIRGELQWERTPQERVRLGRKVRLM